MGKQERRQHRSKNTTQALRYQLESCREAANLDGMVLSDEDGVCLAATGNTNACGEVAARLPLLGRKLSEFEGVLLSAKSGWPIRMERFSVSGSELYMCAIGAGTDAREQVLERSIGGAARILTPTAA